MIDIEEIVSRLEPKVGKVIFIAVDGHGGSGKSTLAKWLGEKLSAEIIHTDDFASWDNPINWWPALIEKVFKPIQLGATSLSYQPTSWWENHHPKPVENQPVTPIMILEGVSSSRREFDEYISYRIFVDTPKAICLERGLARDAATGKSKEELTEIWEEWFAKEEVYMKRDHPKEKADIIIDGTKDFSKQL